MADDDEEVRKRKRRWWFGSGQANRRGVRSWKVEVVQLQTLSGANHYAAWLPGRRAGVLECDFEVVLGVKDGDAVTL